MNLEFNQNTIIQPKLILINGFRNLQIEYGLERRRPIMRQFSTTITTKQNVFVHCRGVFCLDIPDLMTTSQYSNAMAEHDE